MMGSICILAAFFSNMNMGNAKLVKALMKFFIRKCIVLLMASIRLEIILNTHSQV